MTILKHINQQFTMLLTILTALLILNGCVKNIKTVGYTIDQHKLDKIVPGKTRKAIVKRELGSPSTKSSYGTETWYYIHTEYESVAFFEPEVKSQNIIAIKFNDDQTVSNIKRYTEQDFNNITLSKDETKTEGNDVGILGQLLGNVGRFNDRQDAVTP